MSAGRAQAADERCGSRQHGLTLVEVMVAAALACMLAAAAYGWLWGVGHACARETRASEAQSRLAAAHRRLALDLAQALGLTLPLAGLSDRRFALDLIDAQGVPREVEYCWDPSRRVLWRVSSSSYVADGIRAFRVTYLDESGAEVDPSTLGVATDGRVSGVAALAVEASAAAGASTASALWVFALPPARL